MYWRWEVVRLTSQPPEFDELRDGRAYTAKVTYIPDSPDIRFCV